MNKHDLAFADTLDDIQLRVWHWQQRAMRRARRWSVERCKQRRELNGLLDAKFSI